MSDATITATVDTRDVERGLAGILRAGRDVAPVLREARKPLREDLRAHQRERRGPDGPWPGPAAGTVRKRGRTKSGRRRRGRLLGKLPGQVTIAVQGGDTLVARNRVPWASVQQEGGAVGRGAEIPARPFLYFGPEFLDDVQAAAAEHITRGWRRG